MKGLINWKALGTYLVVQVKTHYWKLVLMATFGKEPQTFCLVTLSGLDIMQ